MTGERGPATSILTRLTPDERDLCVELVEDGLGELLTDCFLKDFVSGDGPAIRRTSLAGGETILTWTPVGVTNRDGVVLWFLWHTVHPGCQVL